MSVRVAAMGSLPERVGVIALAASLAAATVASGPIIATDAPPNAPTRPDTTGQVEIPSIPIADEREPIEFDDLSPFALRAWALADSLPDEDWNIAALAEHLAFEPTAAYAFVRDRIRYEPYGGTLRGAQGALAARAGNSVDRSLLLAALLDEMLVDYEFVRAELGDDALARVMAAARVGAPVPLEERSYGSRLNAQPLEDRARRDYALLAAALGAGFPAADGIDEGEAVADARDHMWLRIAQGTDWIDLDPTLGSAMPGEILGEGSATSASVPPDLDHRISIELRLEEIVGGALMERVLLADEYESIDASTSELFLFFRPDASGIGAAVIDVLEGDEAWTPVILVDGVERVGTEFSAGGRGTDLLGDDVELPEPVSARLVVQVTSPDGTEQAGQHQLFDRRVEPAPPGSPIGPAGLTPIIKDGGVPLILAGLYNLQVSTGGADAREFLTHRAQLLDFLGDGLHDDETAVTFSLDSRLWPMAHAARTLVIESEQLTVPAAGGPDGHAYVARPRVYVTSVGPDPSDAARTAIVTDLLIDGVRVLPSEVGGSTVQNQVWYGVLQAALETDHGLRQAQSLDPTDRRGEGVSLVMDSDLDVFSGDSDGPPTGAGPSLRADLDAGRLVVVPEGGGLDAWWAIDPQTGATRARLSPGLGGFRQDVKNDPDRLRTLDNKSYGTYAGSRRSERGAGFKRGSPTASSGGFKVYHSPPHGCGGNEYTIVVGCVSTRAGQVVAASLFVVSEIALYFILDALINGDEEIQGGPAAN